MYLSRVTIDLKNRRSMQALENPEILHGMTETCFSGEKQRILWRLDELNGETILLLLSPNKPDCKSIAEQIGKGKDFWETKDYKPLIDRIQPGTIWRFRLAANPVVNVPQGDGKRGKVKAITIAAHQREWLVRQAERSGFLLAPNQFDVVQNEWRIFRNKGRTISLLCTVFEGILTVSDAAQFIETLQKGIGRGKAYGMGLLTIMSYE